MQPKNFSRKPTLPPPPCPAGDAVAELEAAYAAAGMSAV
jgi:hypothetical protein